MNARNLFFGLCGALGFAAAAVPIAMPVHGQSPTPEAAAPEAKKAKSEGICRSGIDVRYNLVTPPGIPFEGNPPVAVVTMTKPCKGAALARFTAQIDTTQMSQDILVMASAICKDPAGFAGGCTTGQVKQAGPNFYDLGRSGIAPGTHSADFVWRGLKPGKWEFSVIAAGSSNATMTTRKLQVEAFEGG